MYYCNACRDLELPADGARPASLGEILEMMDRVLCAPGGFLGVIDERGGILQFLVGDDGDIGVEIPDPERRGHYGKQSTLSDCKQILGDASGSFHWQEFEGLAFEKW